MLHSISIIVPCFNSAQFLRATLESALNQTLAAKEIIVVDDGSTDGSAAIAESFASPVRLIRQQNAGPSIARNVGTAASSGDLLMYLDADDLLAPEALEVLQQAQAGNENYVALGQCAVFTESPERPVRIDDALYGDFFPAIIKSNLRNPIGWLTPRGLFDKVGGFSDETRPSEDWDFWAQIALCGAELKCVPVVTAYYREHATSIMRTVQERKRAQGYANVMKRLGRGLLEQPKLLERYGDEMFWSAWTALHWTRCAGASWSELAELRSVIRELVRTGPEHVRRSKFGRLINLLGVPVAETLRNFTSRGNRSQAVKHQIAVQAHAEEACAT